MNITQIIDTNPNIQLVISAADLKEFALELLACTPWVTAPVKSAIGWKRILGIVYQPIPSVP